MLRAATSYLVVGSSPLFVGRLGCRSSLVPCFFRSLRYSSLPLRDLRARRAFISALRPVAVLAFRCVRLLLPPPRRVSPLRVCPGGVGESGPATRGSFSCRADALRVFLFLKFLILKLLKIIPG